MVFESIGSFKEWILLELKKRLRNRCRELVEVDIDTLEKEIKKELKKIFWDTVTKAKIDGIIVLRAGNEVDVWIESEDEFMWYVFDVFDGDIEGIIDEVCL